MRKGWEYKKLGEVATFINGYAFKPDQWKESGTPIVRIQNLNNENAPYNYYDGEVPDKVKIQNGDLLISWSASLGAYIWHGGNAFLNQHIFKVAFDKTDIDKFFLKYAVTSKLAAMAEQVHGATMKHIVKKDFDNTQIPYPPLSTQLAIVSELDKINELIRLKKEQLKDFDNLAQSLFYEMFGDPVENEKGWEVKKLGDNVKEMFLGPFGSALKVDSYVPKEDSYCMVYEQKHAIKKTINLENHYINKEKFDGLQRFSVMPGDFIMTCRGTIGKLYQIPKGAPLGIIHPSLMKIRLKENGYDSTYFQFMLTKIIANESTNGNCVQMAITAKALGKKELPLPPLPLQRLFAQRIEQIEREKSEVQKSIQDLETLLASRMQYWFE